MTEIEKMFENANAYEMICMYDSRMEYGDVCVYAESKIKEPCKVCKKAKQKIKYYPDFTAEKQIKLIKLIACNKINKSYRYISLDKDEIDSRWYISLTKETIDSAISYSGKNINFGEALAELINSLWQDLTTQEKEEIRRILNE